LATSRSLLSSPLVFEAGAEEEAKSAKRKERSREAAATG
jgi:hypothetical protein